MNLKVKMSTLLFSWCEWITMLILRDSEVSPALSCDNIYSTGERRQKIPLKQISSFSCSDSVNKINHQWISSSTRNLGHNAHSPGQPHERTLLHLLLLIKWSKVSHVQMGRDLEHEMGQEGTNHSWWGHAGLRPRESTCGLSYQCREASPTAETPNLSERFQHLTNSETLDAGGSGSMMGTHTEMSSDFLKTWHWVTDLSTNGLPSFWWNFSEFPNSRLSFIFLKTSWFSSCCLQASETANEHQ